MTSFKEYQDHVNNQHHGVWKYRCGFQNCGEMFDDSKKCKNHTRLVHRQHGLKPKKAKPPKPKVEFDALCQECGIHYKTKSKFTAHMYYHHNKKDLRVVCPHCKKTILKPRLKQHIKGVHLEIQCA